MEHWLKKNIICIGIIIIGKSVGLLIPSAMKGNIHNDDEYKDLIFNPWKDGGCEPQYKHIAN